MVALLAMLASAFAADPGHARALEQIARDPDLPADVRLDAALALLDAVAPAPATPEPPEQDDLAHLTSVLAFAVDDEAVVVEVHTSERVGAMHYLYERGDERRWVMWLAGVEGAQRQLPLDSGLASRVHVVSGRRVTGVSVPLQTTDRLKVELEELSDGWRLVLRRAGEPES